MVVPIYELLFICFQKPSSKNVFMLFAIPTYDISLLLGNCKSGSLDSERDNLWTGSASLCPINNGPACNIWSIPLYTTYSFSLINRSVFQPLYLMKFWVLSSFDCSCILPFASSQRCKHGVPNPQAKWQYNNISQQLTQDSY